MKQLKKLTGILLALAMIMTLCVTAFAEGETTTSTDPKAGETYTAYLIFDRTSTTVGDKTSASYSIDANSAWYDVVKDYMNEKGYSGSLTLTKSADGSKYVVAGLTETEVANFAAYLAANIPERVTATETVRAAEGTTTFTNLAEGYYLVTSSLGSTVATTDGKGNLALKEKNKVPNVKKEIDTEDAYAQIGDVINYTVTVNTGSGADKQIVLTDTMSKSLTLDTKSFSIKVGNANVDARNYTLDTAPGEGNTWTFRITFTEAYIKGLPANTDIVVTYNATLNASAVTVDKTTNKASIEYSNQKDISTEEVETKTNSFQVKKYASEDSTKANLAGATFQLKKGDTVVKLIKIDYTTYRVAEADEKSAVETFTTVASDNITIKGVDSDETYTLVETKAPAGYNLLTEGVTVEVAKDNSTVSEIANSAGSTLPTTGGMGTTLIYVVGAALAVGAGVVLITRRRMNADQ